MIVQATADTLEVPVSKVAFVSDTTIIQSSVHLPQSYLRRLSTVTNGTITLEVTLSPGDIDDSQYGNKRTAIEKKLKLLSKNVANLQFAQLIYNIAATLDVTDEFSTLFVGDVESSSVTTTMTVSSQGDAKSSSASVIIAVVVVMTVLGAVLGVCTYRYCKHDKRYRFYVPTNVVQSIELDEVRAVVILADAEQHIAPIVPVDSTHFFSMNIEPSAPPEERSNVPFGVDAVDLGQCSICLDMIRMDGRHGAKCDAGHVVCWENPNNCFQDLLDAAETANNINDEGELTCPVCITVKNPYSISMIAGNAPEACVNGMIALRLKVQCNKQYRAGAEERDAHWRQENENYQRLADVDREVYLLKKNVIDNVLPMRCPNPDCNQQFDDFDGCFCLTCGTCNIKFCAWCFRCSFTDTSDVMHAHVRNCPIGNGNVYGDKIRLVHVWNDMRIAKFRELVVNRSGEVKTKLLQELRINLDQLAMRIDNL